jgi:hypothetical protein
MAVRKLNPLVVGWERLTKRFALALSEDCRLLGPPLHLKKRASGIKGVTIDVCHCVCHEVFIKAASHP